MSKTKIISISNQKGGVGKTTTTVNLAAGLAEQGKKVLCIDLDPQGNLSDYLGYQGDELPTMSELMLACANNSPVDPSACVRYSEKNNLEYIPSNIALSSAEFFLSGAFAREKILRRILRDERLSSYDYIFIDCLPSLGILLVNALSASDSVIIPVQAQKFSLDGLDLFLPVFEQVKQNINEGLSLEGILVTMIDNTRMSKAVEEALTERFGSLVFENKIHRSVKATNSSYEQISLVTLRGDSDYAKLGEEYFALSKELIERQNA